MRLLLVKALVRDERGAALLEFLVVATPLLLTFFSLVQISFLYTTDLVLGHAARVSARAAAVIARPNPDSPKPAEADEQVRRAAEVAMGPWAERGAVTNLRVHTRLPDAPFGEITVELRATYTCVIPVAARVVCGLDARREITAHAAFPNQGASYQPFRKAAASAPVSVWGMGR